MSLTSIRDGSNFNESGPMEPDFDEGDIISLSLSRCSSFLRSENENEPHSISLPEDILTGSNYSNALIEGSDIDSSPINNDSSSGESCLESDFEENVEENDVNTEPFSVPLYDGADISTFESYMLLFQFAVRHSLTEKAFSELLQLVSAHVPSSSKVPKSVYGLKQFFLERFPQAKSKIHSYCSVCHSMLTGSSTCQTSGCESSVIEEFLSLPLGPQIRRLMEDPDTWQALQERFRRSDFDGNIRDICDGEQYRQHATFLSHPSNVSLVLNTDGVAIFRSSSVSLWPVWVMVNELPKARRFQKRNMLLAGMWFSRDKPPMNLFLRPIVDDVNELQKDGIEVSTTSGKYVARAILLLCSVDLPARALVINTKQYNGKWGCLYCDNPGTVEPTNQLHRFWPHLPSSTLRTNESIIDDAIQAATTGVAVHGIFGPSVLSLHKPFKLPWCVVIDDLHSIYLGTTLYLLHLWFEKKNISKDFYIGNKVTLCDKKLLQIKVPDCMSRLPKSLQDYTHWKGSELRNWLLFYSLPVLSGILPNPYITHFSLLVAGLLLLSSEQISQLDRRNAKNYLKQFYVKFPELYGEKSTTMNVHLLLHVEECVKQWGPLWGYTCFIYETMNGHFKKLFHGTRNMTKQMAFSFVSIQSLPSLLPSLQNSSPRVSVLTRVLFGRKELKKHVISATTAVVGGNSLRLLSPSIVDLSNEYLRLRGIAPTCSYEDRVQVVYRVEINGQLFFSAQYGRVKRRNSYTILYTDVHNQNRFGLIQYYFITANNVVLAVVQVLETLDTTCQNEFHLTSNELSGIPSAAVPVNLRPCSFDVTDLDSIQQKCLYIDLSLPTKYIVCFPHSLLLID